MLHSHKTPYPNRFDDAVGAIANNLIARLKVANCDPGGKLDPDSVPGVELQNAILYFLGEPCEEGNEVNNVRVRVAMIGGGFISNDEMVEAEQADTWLACLGMGELDTVAVTRLLTWMREVNPEAFADAKSVGELIAEANQAREAKLAKEG